MKNNSPTESILAARAAFTELQSELAHLEAFLASNALLLRERILNADISTGEGIDEIGRLKTLADIVPVRIAARQEELAGKERELIAAVNQFILATLGPRARNLQSKARLKLRAEWAPHYPNSALLDIALEQSDKLHRFNFVQIAINTSPAEGALNFAQNTLDAWDKLAELEAQI